MRWGGRAPRVGGRGRPADRALGPSDAFFAYAESRRVPQIVAAAVVTEASFTREALAAHVASRLDSAPWMRRRLASRWHGLRRPAWRTVPDVDLDWHVVEVALPAPGGLTGLAAAAAEVAGQRFPRDRPPWRMLVLPDLAPDRAGFVIAVHHAVCDGPALIELLGPLWVPPFQSSATARPAPASRTWRSRWAAGLRAAHGVALLATDGMVRAGPFTRPLGPQRRLAVATVPLRTVRTAARAAAGAQPTDVVLAALGGAIRQLLPEASRRRPALRAAVPVLARTGATAADTGNRTAALFVTVPLDEPDPVRRLARVAADRARGGRSARSAGTRFVMERVGGLLPAPVHALAVRASYRGRFFHTIVSVMPGPRRGLRLGPGVLLAAHPVLPLAERVGLAVGGLAWGDALCLGLAGEARVVPDPDRMLAAVLAEIEQLAEVTAGASDEPGAAEAGGEAGAAGVTRAPVAAGASGEAGAAGVSGGLGAAGAGGGAGAAGAGGGAGAAAEPAGDGQSPTKPANR